MPRSTGRYRTLADLAGLSAVEPAVQDSVQGTSLAAVFESPTDLPPGLDAKRAYSQIGRCACGQYCPGGKASGIQGPYLPCTGSNPPVHAEECGANACCRIEVMDFDYMGYTMRTSTRRFTAWVPMDNATLRANWNRTIAMELYDLTNDTGRDFDFDGYSTNLAMSSEHAAEVATLLSDLHAAVNTWY